MACDEGRYPDQAAQTEKGHLMSPTLSHAHHEILHRLAGTRDPVTPTEDERLLYEELFDLGYLGYAYGAHLVGYTIRAAGRDRVTVHRQREKL
jgi:hypothetical protein